MASNKIDYFGLKTFGQNLAKEIGVNTREKAGLVPSLQGQDQPVIYATDNTGQPGWVPTKQVPYLKQVLGGLPPEEYNTYNKIWASNKDGHVGWISNQELLSPRAIDEREYNNIWYWWTDTDYDQNNEKVEFYFLDFHTQEAGKTHSFRDITEYKTISYKPNPWTTATTQVPMTIEHEGLELDKWSFTYSVEITIPSCPIRSNNNIYPTFIDTFPVSKSIVKVEGVGENISQITVKNICFDFLSGRIIKIDESNLESSSLFSYHTLAYNNQNKYRYIFGISFLKNIDKNITSTWKGNNPYAINYENAKKKIKVSLLEMNNCYQVRLLDYIEYPQEGSGSHFFDYINEYFKFAENKIGNYVYENKNLNYIISDSSSSGGNDEPHGEQIQFLEERNYSNLADYSGDYYNQNIDFYFLSLNFFNENGQYTIGSRPWLIKYLITTSIMVNSQEKRVVSQVQITGIGTEITNYKISNIGFNGNSFNSDINEKIFSYHVTIKEQSNGLKRHFGVSFKHVAQIAYPNYPAATLTGQEGSYYARTVNIKLLEVKNCTASLHDLLYQTQENGNIFNYTTLQSRQEFCTSKNGTFNKVSEMLPTSYFNGKGFSGAVPAPASSDNTKFLRGDGIWATPPIMSGATSSSAGKNGLVPTPAAGDQVKFLRGDGTWAVPTYNTVIRPTSVANGTAGLVPALSSAYYDNKECYVLRGGGEWQTPATFKQATSVTMGTVGAVPRPSSTYFSSGAKDPNLVYLSASGWKWTNTFISDNLTDTSTYKALSARMGTSLNNKIINLQNHFTTTYTVAANSTVSIPIRSSARALITTIGTNINSMGLYILYINANGTGIIKPVVENSYLTFDLTTANQIKVTAGSTGCRFFILNFYENNIHEVPTS